MHPNERQRDLAEPSVSKALDGQAPLSNSTGQRSAAHIEVVLQGTGNCHWAVAVVTHCQLQQSHFKIYTSSSIFRCVLK